MNEHHDFIPTPPTADTLGAVMFGRNYPVRFTATRVSIDETSMISSPFWAEVFAYMDEDRAEAFADWSARFWAYTDEIPTANPVAYIAYAGPGNDGHTFQLETYAVSVAIG